MKKVKPIIESRPLVVNSWSRFIYDAAGCSFICRSASNWLNPKAKAGCRLAVFKRPVRGSRKVFIRRVAGFVAWGTIREKVSNDVFTSMAHFLGQLDLTITPQQFFVRLK